MDSSTFTDNNVGVDASEASFTITGSTISDNTWGIFAQSSSGFTIAGCTFAFLDSDGIYAPYSSDFTIEGLGQTQTTFTDMIGAAIDVDNSNSFHIQDCTVGASTQWGIIVDGSTGFQIQNVMVSDCGYAGISAYFAQGFTISNSIIEATNYGGIVL